MFFESRSETDAIELLKKDHRKVDELFSEFEAATRSNDKIGLAQRICEELSVHALAEEKLFYPALRTAFGRDGDDLLDEAEVEHRTLKMLIAEIDGSTSETKLFEANVKVLMEYVKHHVREEENEIMTKARISDVDMEALGQRIEKFKGNLQERMAARASRKPAAGTARRVRVAEVESSARPTRSGNGSNGAGSRSSGANARSRNGARNSGAARKSASAGNGGAAGKSASSRGKTRTRKSASSGGEKRSAAARKGTSKSGTRATGTRAAASGRSDGGTQRAAAGASRGGSGSSNGARGSASSR